jgi:SMC interacting uncharacterized protein involved in chromosome segregation
MARKSSRAEFYGAGIEAVIAYLRDLNLLDDETDTQLDMIEEAEKAQARIAELEERRKGAEYDRLTTLATLDALKELNVGWRMQVNRLQILARNENRDKRDLLACVDDLRAQIKRLRRVARCADTLLHSLDEWPRSGLYAQELEAALGALEDGDLEVPDAAQA